MRIWPDKTVDQEFADLGSSGATGSLNDRQYSYLVGLGHSGALPDLFKSYRLVGEPTFNPAALFTSGEVGMWYDPSDLSTMFTDTAGITPAAVGNAIARINDKSGNGLNATQATASKRPILRQSGALYYLEFDGVDDALVTATMVPATNKAQAFFGVSHDVAATGIVFEHGPNAFDGTCRITANSPSTYTFASRGTVAATPPATAAYGIPNASVLTLLADISAPSVTGRRNGVVATSTADNQGTGNYSTYPVYIGARAGTSFPFPGKMFGMVVRFGANLDADSISETETWMNAKTGAY